MAIGPVCRIPFAKEALTLELVPECMILLGAKRPMKLLVLLMAISLSAQQSQSSHTQHLGDVHKRGESPAGMGFSQTDTTHHFLLTANGGIIQVTANNPSDNATVDAIRNHMGHIAASFASGDFSIPHFVHNQEVPGVKVMKKQKAEIKYTAEQIPAGERVVISTNSATALRAIHDFLRFQIKDHQTGDPTKPPEAH